MTPIRLRLSAFDFEVGFRVARFPLIGLSLIRLAGDFRLRLARSRDVFPVAADEVGRFFDMGGI